MGVTCVEQTFRRQENIALGATCFSVIHAVSKALAFDVNVLCGRRIIEKHALLAVTNLCQGRSLNWTKRGTRMRRGASRRRR